MSPRRPQKGLIGGWRETKVEVNFYYSVAMTNPQSEESRRRRTADLTGGAEHRELPTTPRGLRTRTNLIAAARAIFERDGFLDARLIDITAEAGISAGSFYTYFDSKEEVFAAVLAEVEEEMLHPDVHAAPDAADPVGTIRAANRAYLDSYQRNAKFMRLLNQVASIDDGFREVRRLRTEAFILRNARSIRALQDKGLADPTIDADLASAFLSGMVGRAAFSRFVIGEDWDVEDMIETLTALWVNALKMPSS